MLIMKIKKLLVKVYNKLYDVKEIVLLLINKVLIRTYSFFPLKNYIVLECESDMDDNPRALYEYWINNWINKKYKLIWLVKNVEECKKLYYRKNVVFLNRLSVKSVNQIRLEYYLNFSKYFFFSHPYWFEKKRETQCVVNLWHGTPAKGPDLQNGKLKNCFDYITICNKNVEPFYNQFIDYRKDQIIYCGMARNDYLINQNEASLIEIKRKIEIPLDDKLIICMPTFKKSSRVRDYNIIDKFSLGVVNSEEDIIMFNEYLKQHNTHIVVKLHPLQDLSEIQSVDLSNIHYLQNSDLLKNAIILYELLACSDALLTDFSSVYFDYLILNKPVGFFTELLAHSKRGAMVNNPEDYMAGEKIANFTDLLLFIDNLNKGIDIYENERIKMNKFFNEGNNKSNSKHITNIILGKKQYSIS